MIATKAGDAPATQPIIQTQGLCKSFSHQGQQHHVLKNIDLDLRQGDFTVIMGSSGAGKSTLLYALSGMDLPTLGDVTFAGQDLKQLNESQLAIFRRHHCGFVFQQIYLLETMTLLDNALAAGRLVQADRADVAARARDLLGRVGLNEAVQGKFPAQVSGGEAGRAGIVRALMNRPSVVFADEPTGNLDQSSGQAVLDLMSAANREGQTVLMVTHDLRSALRGNRILFLRDGSITGDLALPGYGADDTDAARLARENTLRSFLVEMGW